MAPKYTLTIDGGVMDGCADAEAFANLSPSKRETLARWVMNRYDADCAVLSIVDEKGVVCIIAEYFMNRTGNEYPSIS